MTKRTRRILTWTLLPVITAVMMFSVELLAQYKKLTLPQEQRGVIAIDLSTLDIPKPEAKPSTNMTRNMTRNMTVNTPTKPTRNTPRTLARNMTRTAAPMPKKPRLTAPLSCPWALRSHCPTGGTSATW